jgi:glycine cleavage system transcriptional repressor
MSRLGGEFTIMLIVEGKTSLTKEEINKAFKKLSEKQITVYVKELSEEEHKKEEEENLYKIIVYGGDKPGIVYNVSKMLAENNINIVDMNTEKAGDLYILITEVEVPSNVKEEKLMEEIEKLKKELGVDINIEKIETVEM